MVDINYCMSSYLAFRYIVDAEKNFSNSLNHKHYQQKQDGEKFFVNTVDEIDNAIQLQFESVKDKKLGILLSGGMDSAILASYMPGGEAYTFRFLGGEYQRDELERAERYADYYGLHLHYVDVDWTTVEKNLKDVMLNKCAPVHSIEPQICEGAKQAKNDGCDLVIIGDGSDYIFGGMDGLLAKEWEYEDFFYRFIYLNPSDVLKEPVDMHYVFEPFRNGNRIDYMGIVNTISIDESYSSYENAFQTAQMPYLDPYELLKMTEPLDLNRVRNGESKYLIRELFTKKYPDLTVPDKLPMPRPVDEYFKTWTGPTRPEFKKNLDMSQFTGNQKWQMWCLERFLNLIGA